MIFILINIYDMKYLKHWSLFEELDSIESYTEITDYDFENIVYHTVDSYRRQHPFSISDVNLLNKLDPYEWINPSHDEFDFEHKSNKKEKCEIGKSYLCKSDLQDSTGNTIALTIFKIEDEYFIVILRLFKDIDENENRDEDDYAGSLGYDIETSYYKCDQLHGLKQLLKDKKII